MTASAKGLMTGLRGLVMGVANNHSIAWGIAQAAAREGAELAFTYQGDSFRRRVEPLAKSVGSDIVIPCDVGDPSSVDTAFETLQSRWESLDFVVHAIAYSDKAELKGRYVDTTLDNFLHTMNISCYSLTAVTRRAEPMMRKSRNGRGGSILTLTYLGAERVMPNYNVMGVAKAALEASVRYLAADLGHDGIRVNAVSAGPMRTLAGSAIADARYVFKFSGDNAPLGRNVLLEDVGNAGLYLLSPLSGGVTGEVHHVDAGFHAVGIPRPSHEESDEGA
ncbi:SDR family oxidoreductase [Fodinicurvata sp. EGI_FJ10296]|uniref:enoyl-ACP reductase FabI n=1 Tax=Fodinicurvata sp. EGI_FJ10296 TaxID=3231908 RepID=UPI003453C44B